MAKYKVLELLTSLSMGKDIQPGAVIEIDDDQAAAILLERGCIIPAEMQKKTAEVKSINFEIKEK